MARKSVRIFLALDVDYPDNAKIIAAGERAEVLYIRASCLAKRMLTDGYIDALQLPSLRLRGVDDRAKKLCEVGLWERVPKPDKPQETAGYRITGWLDRNDTAAEIAEKSRIKAESGKKGGIKSGEVRRGDADPEAPASTNGNHGLEAGAST